MREPVAWGLLAASIGVAFLSSVCRPASAKSTAVNACLPVGHWRVAETPVGDASSALSAASAPAKLVLRVSEARPGTSSAEATWTFELSRGTSWTSCRGRVASEDRCRLELTCGGSEELAPETTLDLALTRSGLLTGTETIVQHAGDGTRSTDFRLRGERVSPLQLDARLRGGPP